MLRYRPHGRRATNAADPRLRIIARLRELLALSDDASISFIESGCSICDCGQCETSIIITRPHQQATSATMTRALSAMTEEDIRQIAKTLA